MAKLSKEERDYVEQSISGYWEQYQGSKNTYFYSNRESISQIRQYMNGDLSPEKYQKICVPEELANEDQSWETIDWTPLDLFTKYRRIALQIVMAMKEYISIDITDSQAVNEREDFFAETVAQIRLRDELKKRGVDPESIGMPSDLPETMKELEMYMEFTFKHVAAVEFEIMLKHIKTLNKYDRKIYKKLIKDLFDLGACVTRDYEEEDGEIKGEYVDPLWFFCSYVHDNDFNNMEFAGQVKRMTIAEMLRLAKCKEDTSRIKELEELMAGTHPGLNSRHPNYASISEKRESLINHQDLDSAHLNVIYCEFLSGQSKSYEIRTTKDGRRIFGKESNGKKNKEFLEADYDMVYEGYHVLGTDVFFACDERDFILRDPSDVKKAKLTYQVEAPEMNHMSINSIGRQVIGIIDAANIAWYKLQNTIRRARPSGIAYDLTSLEAVPIGESGMSPEENVLTFNTTGNIQVRMMDEDGKFQKMPIQELKGGLGTEGEDFRREIEYNVNKFRDITGLNEIVDGSTPNPKTLKSVAQQASQATNNAIKHIHDAAQEMEMQISENFIQRVQDQAETDEIEFYGSALGANSVNFFKMTKDHSMRQLGLRFVSKPTTEEEQGFRESLNAALTTAKGGEAQITIAQKAMLEAIENKKYALMYLSYIVQKNIDDAREQQRALMKEQGEINQQTAAAAQQAAQETLRMEAEIKSKLIDKEYAWRMKIAELEVNGRIGEEKISSEARDRESMRMNETKAGIEVAKENARIEAEKEKENDKEK